jgi:hypothetical protein
MGTAQNQTAAFAIERSCISKSSVPIPENEAKKLGDLNAYVGEFNTGSGTNTRGFGISFTNLTSFDITQLNLAIENKNTKQVSNYLLSNFMAPLQPGTWLTALPEPARTQILKSRANAYFVTSIKEVVKDNAEFALNYKWYLIAIKGIPAN